VSPRCPLLLPGPDRLCAGVRCVVGTCRPLA
jgi:hypothetical protein